MAKRVAIHTVMTYHSNVETSLTETEDGEVKGSSSCWTGKAQHVRYATSSVLALPELDRLPPPRPAYRCSSCMCAATHTFQISASL